MEPIPSTLTGRLADAVREQFDRELPDDVAHHAEMHLLNVIALAASAARSDAVDAVVATALLTGRSGPASIPGRDERLDPELAALAIGVAAHLDDFDDTHLATVIHPSASGLATMLPIAESTGASGETALRAFAIGCEVQLRVGLAMTPAHYDAGWHITGTAGVIGAAATAGLLLGLDAPQLHSALGIAASSTVGQREAFGTMSKPLHAGKAAANGIVAARLAAHGFTGPADALEGEHGYFAVLADRSDPESVLDRFGTHWELFHNTVKPYPCGVVAHPLIDAGRELRERGITPDAVAALRVHCNPLVPDLMGIRTPTDGLQARFSAVHGLAAGIADPIVGLGSYEDVRAGDPVLARLREATELIPEADRGRDAVRVVAELTDGSVTEVVVTASRGSLDRQLTPGEALGKVEALLDRAPGVDRQAVIEEVRALRRRPDVTALAGAARPQGGAR
ncbi:MmgE/PrpD family protein [Microbacterium sp. X-17]|uniref:MmgE/PrpD family protein n=1 Tax=Microbacterium sp. X-17 TaxID=3144404 RepID=UPI0031F4C90C